MEIGCVLIKFPFDMSSLGNSLCGVMRLSKTRAVASLGQPGIDNFSFNYQVQGAPKGKY